MTHTPARTDDARAPKRIQRKRTKGWRMPAGSVYVGRPTKWGNPWRAGHFRPALLVAVFREWIVDQVQDSAYGKPPTVADVRSELRGKDLACWCPLDQPCHADVLLELANQETKS